jgi:uncharacterized protein YjbI with pentapeptide repeats
MLEWCWEWAAWALNNWKFVEVLERLGSFSVLVAVIFYFAESGKRTRQEHYQAWQVINTAQGKGGSGGRIEALQELNNDHVPLIGVDASGAFLQGVRLDRARLLRCNLRSADLRESSFRYADLRNSDLSWANFRGANLEKASFRSSSLNNADLSSANLAGGDFTGADLSDADLRYADLGNIRCDSISSAFLANIYGVRNASPTVTKKLSAAGAVAIQADEEWERLERKSSR